MAQDSGKYQFTGVIGTGATGTVHMAYQPDLQRYVAVKELAPSLAGQPGFLERFRAEAQVMARLESPNCVKVFEFYEVGGRAFLVEEYVDGSSLRKVMDQAGTLTAEQSLGVLKGALSGLGYAHALGLIHRDVKPENLLVDREGVSKLADFGQAVFTGIGPGAAGGIAPGTPAYMSPEAVRGAQLDARSDIYSAGAMLFELLTGRPPYVADTPLAMMRMHLDAAVPDPREINPALPDDVALVVGKALTKDPATRQQSASEFFNELEAAAAAGYGEDWEKRSSIKPLVAAVVGAAAVAAAALPVVAAAPAGGAIAGAQVAAADVAGAGGAGAGGAGAGAQGGVAAAGAGGGLPIPKLHALRAVTGVVLSAALVVGGVTYGANHGILPASAALGTTGLPGVGGDKEAQANGTGGTPATGGKPKVAAAGAGGNGASTVLVLDISGSMDSPALIPAGFPQAKELKQKTDDFNSVLEPVVSGKKVSLGTIFVGATGVKDLFDLNQKLKDYETANNIDPNSNSKLAVLKASADSLSDTLLVENGAGSKNKLGAVTFADSASLLAALTPNVASLKPQIDGLQTDGSTDIGDGLQRAVQMLDGQSAPAIVLLTDGWNNTGMTNDQILTGPVAAASSKGIPICAIGLGISHNDVDQALLTAIAHDTGGGYKFVGDGVSLASTMQEAHGTCSGHVITNYHGFVKPGETASVPAFQVPPGKSRLTLTLTYPGSSMDLLLTDPSGHQVDLSNPATTVRGKGLITTVVSNPPGGGDWTAKVVGKDVPSAGEDFFVDASTDGTTDNPAFSQLTAAEVQNGGTFGDVRHNIRLALVIAAIAAGVAMLLLTIRGFIRRSRARTMAKRGERMKSKFLVPFLLWVVIIVGLIALPVTVGADYLWNTPLISIPKP